MRKVTSILLTLLLLIPLVGCGVKEVQPDYPDAASFEEALDTGADMTGKIVRFTVNEVVPDSAFGYNIQAGEHLNFCSSSNPKVSAGDTITVEVTEVTSMMGSYIISYKMHSTEPAESTGSAEDTTTAEPQSVDFGIGDTWTVDGQWSLTITGVEETEDRNEYSEKSPAAVYIVTYKYENLGYKDQSGIMDGLFFDMDDGIVDSTGKMGYSYPGDVTMYAQEVPEGAYCEAQSCIGVDNTGAFTIHVTKYDGTGTKQEATFTVTP